MRNFTGLSLTACFESSGNPLPSEDSNFSPVQLGEAMAGLFFLGGSHGK